MDQIFSRDMSQSRDRFRAWLARRLPRATDLTLVEFNRPTATGLSHELISVDVIWHEDGVLQERALMVRLDPVRYRKRKTSNLRREFETLFALAGEGSVPIPDVYWYERDPNILGAEFYVMKRLEGRVIGDPPYRREGWFYDLPSDKRRRVIVSAIETMANIHRLPAERLSFLRREGGDSTDLNQHLQYWHSSYQWATASRRNEVADRGWEWLLKNKPERVQTGVSWGDAHPRNLMFHGAQCVAVFDWEDVSLSSPLCDLGRWFMTDRLMAAAGFPLLEGVPTREETVELWRNFTGFDADNLIWFEMLSVCGGAGALSRTIQIQEEHFGQPQSVESKFLPFLNAAIEDLLGAARR